MGAARKREHDSAENEITQAEELETLAEAEARGDVDSPTLHRSRVVTKSEVFSVRLSEEASVALRRQADKEGVSPGALLRRWALGALGKDDEGTLTHRQAEELFRETLQRAAEQAIGSVADAAAGATGHGLNLGPRLVHQRLRERRRSA